MMNESTVPSRERKIENIGLENSISNSMPKVDRHSHTKAEMSRILAWPAVPRCIREALRETYVPNAGRTENRASLQWSRQLKVLRNKTVLTRQRFPQ